MSTIRPEIVAGNFARAPEYYDSKAEMQKFVAASLAELTFDRARRHSVSSVLEIGCGTGFLTRSLFNAFSNADFVVTDISPAMLDHCKRATMETAEKLNLSAKFAVFDASAPPPQEIAKRRFNLVTSSLAFQWIEDLNSLSSRISRLLRDSGIFAFTTLGDGTFRSISKIFEKYDLELPSPRLPNTAELSRALDKFDIRDFRQETITNEFNSMLDFLRHIRGIGAGNATGKQLSVAKLAKLAREFGREPVSVEYDVMTVVAVKSQHSTNLSKSDTDMNFDFFR